MSSVRAKEHPEAKALEEHGECDLAVEAGAFMWSGPMQGG